MPINELPKLRGKIISVERFTWEAGGGQCARGTLLITHEIDYSLYD
jgi:hypothetical protein